MRFTILTQVQINLIESNLSSFFSPGDISHLNWSNQEKKKLIESVRQWGNQTINLIVTQVLFSLHAIRSNCQACCFSNDLMNNNMPCGCFLQWHFLNYTSHALEWTYQTRRDWNSIRTCHLKFPSIVMDEKKIKKNKLRRMNKSQKRKDLCRLPLL